MAATLEEIVNALRGTGLSDEAIAQLASWADFVLNNSDVMADIIAGEEGVEQQFRNALVGDPSPAAIEFARNMAERARETLAKGLELSELRKMGEQIAKAIEDGIHPHEAARRLTSIQGLDSNRAKRLQNYGDYLDALDPALTPAEWERRYEAMFQKLLRERRREAAQTEMRKATSTANQEKAAARGATHTFWTSEGGSKVCKICQANEAEGIVEFGHKFKASGTTTPPGHLGSCRCSMGYIFNESQLERMRPLMDARIASTAAAVSAGEDAEPRAPV